MSMPLHQPKKAIQRSESARGKDVSSTRRYCFYPTRKHVVSQVELPPYGPKKLALSLVRLDQYRPNSRVEDRDNDARQAPAGPQIDPAPCAIGITRNMGRVLYMPIPDIPFGTFGNEIYPGRPFEEKSGVSPESFFRFT